MKYKYAIAGFVLVWSLMTTTIAAMADHRWFIAGLTVIAQFALALLAKARKPPVR